MQVLLAGPISYPADALTFAVVVTIKSADPLT